MSENGMISICRLVSSLFLVSYPSHHYLISHVVEYGFRMNNKKLSPSKKCATNGKAFVWLYDEGLRAEEIFQNKILGYLLGIEQSFVEVNDGGESFYPRLPDTLVVSEERD